MLTRLLTLLAVASAANTVKDCSSGTSLFKFVSASLTPDPVVPGQDSALSISMEIPDGTAITDGTSTYSISLNGIPFPGTTDPLCSQVTCPLVGGPYSNTTISQFPAGVSGKIVTKMIWRDDSNVQLYCLEVTVRV